MRTIEKQISEMKFELHRETSIPRKEYNRKRNKKYQVIYDLIEEFVSSDMDIASVDIPAHFDNRNKTLFEQAMRYAARANDIKTSKRDNKMYLSKINKED